MLPVFYNTTQEAKTFELLKMKPNEIKFFCLSNHKKQQVLYSLVTRLNKVEKLFTTSIVTNEPDNIIIKVTRDAKI